MYEWIPILAGFFLGSMSVLVSQGRMHRLAAFTGILLIALNAVFLSGEWRSNPMYFSLDLVEAFGGFVAGAVSVVGIRCKSSSPARKTTAPQ